MALTTISRVTTEQHRSAKLLGVIIHCVTLCRTTLRPIRTAFHLHQEIPRLYLVLTKRGFMVRLITLYLCGPILGLLIDVS